MAGLPSDPPDRRGKPRRAPPGAPLANPLAGPSPAPPERPAWRRAAGAVWRPAVFALGWVCLALGVAGLFLPLLPGTLFLIAAAACFTHSSPRFEAWLLDHPRFGPPVRGWRATGAIPRTAKAFAVASLAASGVIVVLSDAPDAVRIGCPVLFVAVAAYVVPRPPA